MNLSEFKAWFEGFTENLEGKPTDKQWKRITAKIAEIKDAPPVSYPVYVNRYWGPYYNQPWWSYGAGIGVAQAGSLSVASVVGSNAAQITAAGPQPTGEGIYEWNSADGFRALGRADAENLN